jgi:cephalosporin hydroxylase
MMKISDVYIPTEGDVGYGDKNTVHSYMPVYDELLAPYEHTKATILEIGVAHGHSVKMLHSYFQQATVVGVDINLSHANISLSRLTLIEGDASQVETFKDVNNLDVVIDDGSHRPDHQLATFKILWNKMNKGGIYVIEDIENITSFAKLLLDDPFTRDIAFDVYDLRQEKNRYDDVLVVAYKQ